MRENFHLGSARPTTTLLECEANMRKNKFSFAAKNNIFEAVLCLHKLHSSGQEKFNRIFH